MIFRRTKGFKTIIEDIILIEDVIYYLNWSWKVWLVIQNKTNTTYKRICLTKNGKGIKLKKKNV